jgi:hypothetical protein
MLTNALIFAIALSVPPSDPFFVGSTGMRDTDFTLRITLEIKSASNYAMDIKKADPGVDDIYVASIEYIQTGTEDYIVRNDRYLIIDNLLRENGNLMNVVAMGRDLIITKHESVLVYRIDDDVKLERAIAYLKHQKTLADKNKIYVAMQSIGLNHI